MYKINKIFIPLFKNSFEQSEIVLSANFHLHSLINNYMHVADNLIPFFLLFHNYLHTAMCSL